MSNFKMQGGAMAPFYPSPFDTYVYVYRTVARKASIGGFTFVQGGLDIQI